MKVRDKTTLPADGTTTAAMAAKTKGTSNVVKCVLNFDQLSYRPGSGVKCMITLTFAEEFEYRSRWIFFPGFLIKNMLLLDISIRFLGQSNTSFNKRKVAAFKHRFARYSASQEHFRWYKDVVSSVDGKVFDICKFYLDLS